MENLSRVRDLPQIRIGSLALAYVRSRKFQIIISPDRASRVHARRESMAADIDCRFRARCVNASGAAIFLSTE
jgi:hypothetical protein